MWRAFISNRGYIYNEIAVNGSVRRAVGPISRYLREV